MASVMAEGGGAELERKEMSQPIKWTPVTSMFHRGLDQRRASSTTAVQEQKEAFESELKTCCGEEALDAWDRYIRWTLQSFPLDGKESNLPVILERAVSHFVDEERFYNDARYVSFWIKLAEKSMEPLNVYEYMRAQKIGVRQAAFYHAWAEELARRGNHKRAASVYQDCIRCGAEPFGELQQSHGNGQVCVFSRASSSPEDPAIDKLSPERVLLQGTSPMNLEARGKEKAVAPHLCSQVLSSDSGHNQALNIPAVTHNARTNRIAVFDEYAPGASRPGPFQCKPMPRLASPDSSTKENDFTPEQGTNVKRLKICSFDDCAAVAAQRTQHAQPVMDETDWPPQATKCVTNPEVDDVFLKSPSYATSVGSSTLPVRSLCLKDRPLLSSDTEPSFQKLGLLQNCYATPQEPEGKERLQSLPEAPHLQTGKKRTLLQEYIQQSAPQHQTSASFVYQPLVVRSEPQSARSESDPHGSAVRLGVHSESSDLPPPKFLIQDYDSNSDVFMSPNVTDGVVHRLFSQTSDDSPLETPADRKDSNFAPFTIFDECSPGEPLRTVTPVPARSNLSRRPLAVIWEPHTPGRTERLRNPSTGNQNEVPFSTPEDVSSCTPVAQRDSTPYRPRDSARNRTTLDHSTSSPRDAPPDSAKRWKKLSPIEETSLEDNHSASSSSASSSASTDKMTSPPETSADVEMVDPCSVSVRRHLLEEVDLTSCPGFYRKQGPLPSLHEHDMLSPDIPGGEPFIIPSKVISGENHDVYFGKSKTTVIVECVPWNFYIITQLRNRLTADPRWSHSDQTSCFQYEDGCITTSRGDFAGTLQEFVAGSLLQRDSAAALAIELVEMVERMHACRLVHGDLRPETLVLKRRGENGEGPCVLGALDFSCCLDLELQPDVTSCQALPAAQAYLRQGVLSPSSSPYQVDLLGIAETVHAMLRSGNMQLVEENSEWKLAEDPEVGESSSGDADVAAWREFFQKLLNPGARSTVTVLSELQLDLRKHFLVGREALSAFSL